MCRERNYLLLFRIVRLGGNNSILSRWCQLLLLIQTPRSHNNSMNAVLGRHCIENPGKRLWLREGWGVEMGHCKAQYHRTHCNSSQRTKIHDYTPLLTHRDMELGRERVPSSCKATKVCCASQVLTALLTHPAYPAEYTKY